MIKILCPLCESEVSFRRDSFYGNWGYWCKNRKCRHHQFAKVPVSDILIVEYTSIWERIAARIFGK